MRKPNIRTPLLLPYRVHFLAICKMLNYYIYLGAYTLSWYGARASENKACARGRESAGVVWRESGRVAHEESRAAEERLG